MIVYKNFEWDVRESAASLAACGVSFKEASTVFTCGDVTIAEEPGSGRLRAIGRSERGRTLVVLHQRGARLRILGAALHVTRPDRDTAPEPTATEPAAMEPAAMEPAAPAPVAMKSSAPAPVAMESAAPEAVPAGPASTPAPAARPAAAGWTAETYDIYWQAYSAARQAARREGKTPREAQRLGKEAGERAVLGASARSQAPARTPRPASREPAAEHA